MKTTIVVAALALFGDSSAQSRFDEKDDVIAALRIATEMQPDPYPSYPRMQSTHLLLQIVAFSWWAQSPTSIVPWVTKDDENYAIRFGILVDKEPRQYNHIVLGFTALHTLDWLLARPTDETSVVWDVPTLEVYLKNDRARFGLLGIGPTLTEGASSLLGTLDNASGVETDSRKLGASDDRLPITYKGGMLPTELAPNTFINLVYQTLKTMIWTYDRSRAISMEWKRRITYLTTRHGDCGFWLMMYEVKQSYQSITYGDIDRALRGLLGDPKLFDFGEFQVDVYLGGRKRPFMEIRMGKSSSFQASLGQNGTSIVNVALNQTNAVSIEGGFSPNDGSDMVDTQTLRPATVQEVY